MTEQYIPKKRDRARLFIEGDVEYTEAGPREDGGHYFEVGKYGFNTKDAEILSIEKVGPKLPTMPGSVVRIGGDYPQFYLLTPGAYWVGARGQGVSPGILSGYDYEIVHDAGVTSDRNNQEEK